MEVLTKDNVYRLLQETIKVLDDRGNSLFYNRSGLFPYTTEGQKQRESDRKLKFYAQSLMDRCFR